MRKLLFLGISMGLMFIFVACGGKKVDDVTSEKLLTKAEDTITFINKGDYKKVYEMFDKTMKKELPLETLTKNFAPVIEESGSFEEVTKSSVEEEDRYYVTSLVVKYSNKDRIFTVSFNDQEEIAGLFVQ